MPHDVVISAARTLAGVLALVAALHAPAASQAFLSTSQATCVGGGIGCKQVDFFFEILPATQSATIDAFTIAIVPGAGWFFNLLQAGEAEDPIGPLLYTGFVSDGGLRLDGIFEPDEAVMDPWLRIRAEFMHGPDDFSSTASLQYSYSLYDDGALIAAGPTNVVPEPVSMALLGTGLAGVAAARRRRRSPESDEAA